MIALTPRRTSAPQPRWNRENLPRPSDAAGAAQGPRQEAESLMRAQGEKILANMDIVKREEFEAVKAMAEKARAENERLAGLVAALEARIAALESSRI